MPSAPTPVIDETPRPLTHAVADASQHDRVRPWTRYVYAVEPVPLFDWLRAQSGGARTYWGRRGTAYRIAGAGWGARYTGHNFDVLDALPRDAREAPDGGMQIHVSCRFDVGAAAARPWQAFAPVTAGIPAVSLTQRDGLTWLSVVYGANPATTQEALRTAARCQPPTPRPASVSEDEPADRATWRAGIERVLEEIDARRLEKGVFTRRVRHRTPQALDPVDVLAQLDAGADDAYRFLVQPDVTSAFVGLSPERLYRRRRDTIQSEALAGTTRRSATPDTDALLGERLLASDKDRREHDLVRRHIESHLEPLADELSSDEEPHVEQLAHVQHLRTEVRGRLKPGVRDAQVLAALHPTPAVCGAPTDAALQVLRAHEGFDRGLYCGLVGTLGCDEAEFAVAIRSALIRGCEVEVFAGAGIVQGSDPDKEWDETVDKLKTIGDVIAPGERGEA